MNRVYTSVLSCEVVLHLLLFVLLGTKTVSILVSCLQTKHSRTAASQLILLRSA